MKYLVNEKKIDDLLKEIFEILNKNTKSLGSKSLALTTPLGNLQNAIELLKKSQKVDNKSGIDAISLERYFTELEENQSDQKAIKDHTSFNVFSKLPNRPYSKSSVGSTVIITRKGHGDETLDAKAVFTQLVPGQITFRWQFGARYRISCGIYSTDSTPELVSWVKSVHKISNDPIHQYLGRPVHAIERLTATSLQGVTSRNYIDQNGEEQRRRGGLPICPTCLSLNIFGGERPEQCNHVRDGTVATIGRSSLYAAPILDYIEITGERSINNTTKNDKLPFPLNQIFEQVDYLDNTQVLTVAKGFSREAAGVNVRIRYNPYLGYKTDTYGLSFTIKDIPSDFIDQVLNQNVLVRDIVIDILQEKIETILDGLHRSHTEIELWLSGIIKSLGLDSITTSFDYKKIHDRLNETDVENRFTTFVNEEIGFYMPTPAGLEQSQNHQIYAEIRNITISEEELKLKIKSLIKNSLSYLVYQTGLITSGSTGMDMGFIHPGEDSNEILIYDDVNGGNGASKLIHDYLIGEQKSYSPMSGVRPKFFQEIFFELLQPCSQGTADRIFFRNLAGGFVNFSKNDITTKFKEIEEQRKDSPAEFTQVINAGIDNMFPYAIGKRALPNETDENKKIQEIANICIHGCFECGLLQGNYSGIKGPQLEKFYVSKQLLDMYFRFHTARIRRGVDTSVEDIIDFLDKDSSHMVILSQTSADPNDFNRLIAKLNLLLGEEENNMLLKFSGMWFDCPISSTEIEMSILLAMVDVPDEI